jgi:hypothetical protein
VAERMPPPLKEMPSRVSAQALRSKAHPFLGPLVAHPRDHVGVEPPVHEQRVDAEEVGVLDGPLGVVERVGELPGDIAVVRLLVGDDAQRADGQARFDELLEVHVGPRDPGAVERAVEVPLGLHHLGVVLDVEQRVAQLRVLVIVGREDALDDHVLGGVHPPA